MIVQARSGIAALALFAAGWCIGHGAIAGVGFTASQATRGEALYEQHCAACHGRRLEGASAGPLAGADFMAINKRRHATVGDIFEITRSQMPLNAPASLNTDQYVEIMAFVLKSNGFKPGTQALAASAARNSKVPLYR